MAFSDKFFKKVEDKTNVSKASIMDLAAKIQNKDLKDENVLKELIQDVSKMAGKPVTKEQEEKIINAVINDKIPNNMDNIL